MNAYAVVYRNEGELAHVEMLSELLADYEGIQPSGYTAERAALKAAIAALSQPYTLHTLCKTPECAVESISPFEGAEVFGMATIAVESEPVSGLRYRVQAKAAEVG